MIHVRLDGEGIVVSEIERNGLAGFKNELAVTEPRHGDRFLFAILDIVDAVAQIGGQSIVEAAIAVVGGDRDFQDLDIAVWLTEKYDAEVRVVLRSHFPDR